MIQPGIPPTCPKCFGAMRTYDRSGVTVDQCQDCRGIFLDRGELEALIDAENGYNERNYGMGPDTPRSRFGYNDYPGGGHHGSGRHGRRRGFLGGLFDD